MTVTLHPGITDDPSHPRHRELHVFRRVLLEAPLKVRKDVASLGIRGGPWLIVLNGDHH